MINNAQNKVNVIVWYPLSIVACPALGWSGHDGRTEQASDIATYRSPRWTGRPGPQQFKVWAIVNWYGFGKTQMSPRSAPLHGCINAWTREQKGFSHRR
jgi:hypothetical protein